MIDDPHDEWSEEVFYAAGDRVFALCGQEFWECLAKHPAVKGAYMPLYMGVNAGRYFAEQLSIRAGKTVMMEMAEGAIEERLRELGIETHIYGEPLRAEELRSVLPADKPFLPGGRRDKRGREHPTSPFQNRRHR